jgi:rod shape-determining protein MreD
MNISDIKVYLYLAVAAALQLTILHIIELDGVLPILWIIVLFYFTLQNGRLWGIVTAAIFGFVYDLVSGGTIGSTMFSGALAIYIGGLFTGEQKNDRILHSYSFITIILLIASVFSIVLSLLTNLDIRSSLATLLFKQGLFPGLYTAAFASFVVIVAIRKN